MSFRVKKRLADYGIETNHEERQEIDKEIEKQTEKCCDEGISDLSDLEFLTIVRKIKKKKIEIPVYV